MQSSLDVLHEHQLVLTRMLACFDIDLTFDDDVFQFSETAVTAMCGHGWCLCLQTIMSLAVWHEIYMVHCL